MPIKKTKNHIPKWSVGKYLIFITILVLAFSIVISRQEQANQKKKSNNNQNSEDEEPKFIILKDGDESELESLPEEFKQKIKEALSKVKNLNLPSEQEVNALNNNIPDQQQGKPSQSAKPTSQIEETTDTSMLSDISIPLDEIIIPTEYSSTLDEEFTRIKRMKELKLVTRRKFMSKKLNDLRKQQENETQKKDSTEKLLEARMILDPDLQVYEKEAVEKAIGIYLSVIKEDPTNPLVLYNLGTLYKSEKFGVKDFSKSKTYYILASYLGSQMSQFEVALLYSNNLISTKDLENVKNLIIELFGPVETMKKQIKLIYEKIPQSMENTETLSLLNLFYSSLGGNTEANIALGYRHMFGHGVPKSCKTASYYYSKAASDIISEFEDSRMPLIDHVRLNDETAIQNKQSQEDIMEYYQYSASKGSSSSMLIYGYANLYGIRGVEQNGEVARRLFEQAAEAGEHEAFGALGNMFLKGAEGIPKNNETAFKYFKKGADKKDPSSLNGLGKMYLEGSKDEQGNVILEKNFELAAGYFNKSASLGNSEAHYNLGLLYLDGKGVKKSFKQAMQHFAISAQHGQVLAKYQLANMYLHGLGTNPNCEIAVKFLKSVVEKASWTSLMESAFEKFVSGEDQHTALLLYQHAAEMGIEIAQANLAFMYDRGYGFEEISSGLSEEESELLKFKGAIKWYQQAAEQGNVDAYVKVGDYYYYGSSALSSSNSSVGSLEQSFEKSIYFYRRAKELNNAQAMFNLGYMHEHGKGLPQDFHLAKRYYDMASDADPVAYVPVIMALGKLYAHWGFYLAKDYVSNILDGEMTSSEIDETSNSDISTWLINLIIEHEDYFLAILIGGLALLIFVRHVVNSQANARPRRRRPATENAQQENVANNEQVAQQQEELHEHQE